MKKKIMAKIKFCLYVRFVQYLHLMLPFIEHSGPRFWFSLPNDCRSKDKWVS